MGYDRDAIASAATPMGQYPAVNCIWSRSSPAWAAAPATEASKNTQRAECGRCRRRQIAPSERAFGRRNLGLLRPLPSHLVADRFEWTARREQCSFPPYRWPIANATMRPTAHPLHCLPRPARSDCKPILRVTTQMRGLPLRRPAHQSLPRGEGRLRRVPYAQSGVAGRAR